MTTFAADTCAFDRELGQSTREVWPIVPADTARRLGELAATSGRAPIARLG